MIVGERVRLARDLHQLTQARLVADVPGMTQSRLSRIEKGLAELSTDDVSSATIAALTGVTIEWLGRPLEAGFHGLSPHFRARSRTTESTKAAALAWATLVNEAHELLADRVRIVPVRLAMEGEAAPSKAARQMRFQLGFDALQPLPYLILALERLGVRVLGLPWTAPSVDAFCAWTESIPTIALATGVPGDRLRWNVAHELGHLVLHDDSKRGKEVEAEADAFAAELLTPLDALRIQMPRHPTLGALTMLKSQWGVSVKSLVRRARELNAVDDERATSLYRQISARGWNKAEPGYVPREKPRGLRKKFEIALGRVDSERVALETGWSMEMADLILDQHATVEELPAQDVLSPSDNGRVVALTRRTSKLSF